MKKTIWVFFLVAMVIKISYAQVLMKQEIDLNNFIQNLTPVQTEDINYEDLYENLFTLYQNPIDINRADAVELRSLFLLSESKINAIISHRLKYGAFLSIYELQAVDGISIEDIRLILPFITIKNIWGVQISKNFASKSTEHYLLLRADQILEPSRGYREDKYLGSRQRYYTRYRMAHARDYSMGFVSEKDAGEKKFFDFANFHIQVQNKAFLKNIVLGDYLVQFGQGMIFSAGFAPGKGSEPVYTTRRGNLGIKPFNSVLENGSLRGIANTLKFKNLEITSMYGRNRRDASVTEMEDDQDTYFSSILSSGFHRTESEIANKDQIIENNYGGNILYRLPHLHLGFSVLHTAFNQDFKKREQLYNFYEFTGKNNTVLGPNFSISWQNFNFFGEAARSSSGGMGYILGSVGSLGPKVEWALNLRNYAPDFHSFYGSAFRKAQEASMRGEFIMV
ncbi:MAG: helix-hairpin-helix domain-containing protein [Cytophagaceae bacterium]|nr:helix-hairpin-helix domain-containing protein [Cytophagaceae bacterium]